MAIPEVQLETWSNIGATKAAASTYASIKAAIDADSDLAVYEYEVYLQGSYRNSTNIYGDMDVDVLVESSAFFYYDIDGLTDQQKLLFNQRFPNGSAHSFSRFREAVQKALLSYYAANLIVLRNKCIKVGGDSGRLDADVVPCVQYRDYRKDGGSNLPEPCEGVVFYTRDTARKVVNYPSQHYDNGVAKNKATYERFKPAVRIFKNLRNYCVEGKLVSAKEATSYFVSCLIYNAPSQLFKSGKYDTVLGILQWMHDLTDEDWNQLVCQNELFYLCRDLPDLWKPADAKKFCRAAISSWNDWE